MFMFLYYVFQEESTKLQECISYLQLHRRNQNYGDNGERCFKGRELL